MRSRKTILLSAVLAALALSAVASSTASASPQWHFGGTLLTEFEGETVVGAAFSSSLKSGGAATTCEHFLYNMEVWNGFGIGEGLVWELPLFDCSTTAPHCTVTSIEAEKLPWLSHDATIGGKEYLVLEEIDVKIAYSGASCALPKTVTVKGTAGGLINNTTSTATFSKASFEATGTSLKIGTEAVEWTGEFPMEAFEASREKAVEVF
jgi:hypothetical protein